MSEVSSTFQKRPAYRYIRNSDKLPTYAEIIDTPLEQTIAKVKLFNPTGIGTWWIAAYDPDTGIAYGVSELHERELGSISMTELVALRPPPFGLPIERDLHYKPASLSAVLQGGS